MVALEAAVEEAGLAFPIEPDFWYKHKTWTTSQNGAQVTAWPNSGTDQSVLEAAILDDSGENFPKSATLEEGHRRWSSAQGADEASAPVEQRLHRQGCSPNRASTYVCSTFHSNLWPIFGKLREDRSRLAGWLAGRPDYPQKLKVSEGEGYEKTSEKRNK